MSSSTRPPASSRSALFAEWRDGSGRAASGVARVGANGNDLVSVDGDVLTVKRLARRSCAGACASGRRRDETLAEQDARSVLPKATARGRLRIFFGLHGHLRLTRHSRRAGVHPEFFLRVILGTVASPGSCNAARLESLRGWTFVVYSLRSRPRKSARDRQPRRAQCPRRRKSTDH